MMRASGISTGFPVLSRSSGQVAHVLRARSPLSTRASPGFTFDLHVLSAPPAFVLSQDQTLHRDHQPGRPGEPDRTWLSNPLKSCRSKPLTSTDNQIALTWNIPSPHPRA